MAFCSKCGKELSDGAQFCANCGAPVNGASDGSTRVQKFVGEINKCPSCGAVLQSGVLKCPECGYEIRGAQASKAAAEFNNQLKTAKTQQEYFNIIESFAVPTTREDIGYFLAMAKTNVERDYNPDSPQDVQLHKSWVIHFNNLKNRVSTMDEKDKHEFQSIIDNTKIAERYSTREVDAFRISLAKTLNPKAKINLIKTYPIKPNSENLMSLVNFIDSQIEYKNPLLQFFKTLGLAILYIYTLGIAYLILQKKRKENGTIDYSNQSNKAWFVRLCEIQKQTSLLEENPAAKEKINSVIKSIKIRKMIVSLICFVVFFVLIGFPIIRGFINSVYGQKEINEKQTVSTEVKE